ncbi:hypothetical protein ACL7TT_11655 [Microbulbifer sp. 2304DJ12-6]|uniref:hypothetical protein n=1 Tax=Microbulbifer sp. 2304DJ12-6 TaxID=3233340 RepID=UPI0039AFCF4D
MENLLSKTEILGADDLLYEEVAVPEWGGTVRVRNLTGGERDQFEAYCVSAGQNGVGGLNKVRATAVSLTVVDKNGERLFTEGDVEALNKKSGAALDRVFTVAQRLNKLSEADIEELKKNFQKAPGEDSCSD